MIETNILHIDSEIGKIFANKCLKLGYDINLKKLENLMLVIHGKMLIDHNHPFLVSEIVSTERGIRIPQLEKDFIQYCVSFSDELQEYVPLTKKPTKAIDHVIKICGHLTANEISSKAGFNLLHQYCLENGINDIPNEIIKNAFATLTWLDDGSQKELEC